MNCAGKLKLLADETRLAVMERLLRGSCHAGELAEELDVEQSLMSHHLKLLRGAGLVHAKRDGKAVLYSLAAGVETRSAGAGINLECCQLTFERKKKRKGRGR